MDGFQALVQWTPEDSIGPVDSKRVLGDPFFRLGS